MFCWCPMPRCDGLPSPSRWPRNSVRWQEGSGPRGGRTRESARQRSRYEAGKKQQGILWSSGRKHVRPVKVSIGLTDGTMTEVQGEDLQEGLEVVVGEQRQGTTERRQPIYAADNETQPPPKNETGALMARVQQALPEDGAMYGID